MLDAIIEAILARCKEAHVTTRRVDDCGESRRSVTANVYVQYGPGKRDAKRFSIARHIDRTTEDFPEKIGEEMGEILARGVAEFRSSLLR